MSRFELLQPNYYKRDKPLGTWDIEDQAEIIVELVPTDSSDGKAPRNLQLAKREEHRRKHSVQVSVVTAPEILSALYSETPTSPGAQQLQAEQSIQLDLGARASQLLQHLVKTFRLANNQNKTSYRLRLMNNTDLLGSSFAEDGILCQPSDTVRSDQEYRLEYGQGLADNEVMIRAGLIIGNDRSHKGGGGTSTKLVELVAAEHTRVSDFKNQVLRATWSMNSPKSSEPGQWRFRKVTLMGDLGDLLTEHGDIGQAGLSNGSVVWLEQGAPPKKDAVNVSVKLWLPIRKSLDAADVDSSAEGIPLKDMSKHSETKGDDDVNASAQQVLDPTTIIAESNALRSDSLLSIRVFEALSSTTLGQVKRAILQDSRVIAAVNQGFCGDIVRALLQSGQLTEHHVRFRYLEQRNVPGKIFKGSKRHSMSLKDLHISSGKTGRIGRHFVAELRSEPEDLPDSAVVRLCAMHARCSIVLDIVLYLTGFVVATSKLSSQHTSLATLGCHMGRCTIVHHSACFEGSLGNSVGIG